MNCQNNLDIFSVFNVFSNSTGSILKVFRVISAKTCFALQKRIKFKLGKLYEATLFHLHLQYRILRRSTAQKTVRTKRRICAACKNSRIQSFFNQSSLFFPDKRDVPSLSSAFHFFYKSDFDTPHKHRRISTAHISLNCSEILIRLCSFNNYRIFSVESFIRMLDTFAHTFEQFYGKNGFIFYDCIFSDVKTRSSFRYFVSELDVFIID
jgi:hypothetical protein